MMLAPTVDHAVSVNIQKKWKDKYGHLPEKMSEIVPWETICVDLIGPYTIHNWKGD